MIEPHDISSSDFVGRFMRAIDHLPDAEREIVTRTCELVAEGAGAGLGDYGPLRLATDKRDFEHEAVNELRDFFFYHFAAQLKREHALCNLDRDSEVSIPRG